MTFLLLVVSIIPVFLLGLYIYKKDSVKEPKPLLIGLFVAGFLALILVVLVSIIMYFLVPDFYILENTNNYSGLQLFGLIFFEIALIEEFFKWLMIRVFGYNNKNFDQLYDIVVYSVFVALGFAAIENIIYVLPQNLFLGFLRAIFAVPGHVAFGVFMGYFLGLAKIYRNRDKRLFKLYMLSSVLVPTSFHAIYDFCLLKGEYLYLFIFLGFVIVLFISAFKRVNTISKTDQNL